MAMTRSCIGRKLQHYDAQTATSGCGKITSPALSIQYRLCLLKISLNLFGQTNSWPRQLTAQTIAAETRTSLSQLSRQIRLDDISYVRRNLRAERH
jgi:hypothetical protein